MDIELFDSVSLQSCLRHGVGGRYFGWIVKDPAEVWVVGERLLDADYCIGDVRLCERKYIDCHLGAVIQFLLALRMGCDRDMVYVWECRRRG